MAAKLRTAIVINITVLAGMCVRKSSISLHRSRRRQKKNIAIASMFQRDRNKLALDLAR
jgi:hypothetical protein